MGITTEYVEAESLSESLVMALYCVYDVLGFTVALQRVHKGMLYRLCRILPPLHYCPKTLARCINRFCFIGVYCIY